MQWKTPVKHTIHHVFFLATEENKFRVQVEGSNQIRNHSTDYNDRKSYKLQCSLENRATDMFINPATRNHQPVVLPSLVGLHT